MNAKQMRTIHHASERLFGVKSWLPNRSETIRGLGSEIFAREVKVHSERSNYLSEVGLGYFRAIVSTIDEAGYFQGQANYSDIWAACKKMLSELLKNEMQPETAEELLQLVRKIVEKEICSRSFIISLYGIQLKDIEVLELGRFRLARPSAKILRESGILDEEGRIPTLMAQMNESQLWFIGTVEATDSVACREFFHQARLTAGLFAVSAASTFERGAEAFRIGAAASPEEARTPSNTYLSWVDGNDHLGFTRQFRKGQDYEINAVLANQLGTAPVFLSMLRILQQAKHNSLEAAIVRAVYWFSDAHKDPAAVMRFVKFWSCIESFFSHEQDITKSVSVGTAAVLTFGAFRFVPNDKYLSTRRRLATFYGKRSKAVHNGMHDHVEPADLEDLSQWAAWLIISMAEMSDRYVEARDILSKCIELDAETTMKKS